MVQLYSLLHLETIRQHLPSVGVIKFDCQITCLKKSETEFSSSGIAKWACNAFCSSDDDGMEGKSVGLLISNIA